MAGIIISAHVCNDEMRKAVWSLANARKTHDGRRMVDVLVQLANNTWNVGILGETEDTHEWQVHRARFDWLHVAGTAQKQPKSMAKDPIRDYFDRRFAKELQSSIKYAADELFAHLDSVLDDDAITLTPRSPLVSRKLLPRPSVSGPRSSGSTTSSAFRPSTSFCSVRW